MGKRKVFNNFWKNTIKPEPLHLTPYKKISMKWITDLNIEAKTIQLLEEKPLLSCSRQRFLKQVQKTLTIKQKMVKLIFIKI